MATRPKTLGPPPDQTRRYELANMYKSRRWRHASEAYRRQNPFCVACQREDILNAEDTCVDHIRPHNGDWDLFWDPDNWQTLCRTHNALKAMGK